MIIQNLLHIFFLLSYSSHIHIFLHNLIFKVHDYLLICHSPQIPFYSIQSLNQDFKFIFTAWKVREHVESQAILEVQFKVFAAS
jgi:hypothetical protein